VAVEGAALVGSWAPPFVDQSGARLGGTIASASAVEHRARSHCRFVPTLIHFIPDFLT
jgi:hypothetical protein